MEIFMIKKMFFGNIDVYCFCFLCNDCFKKLYDCFFKCFSFLFVCLKLIRFILNCLLGYIKCLVRFIDLRREVEWELKLFLRENV